MNRRNPILVLALIAVAAIGLRSAPLRADDTAPRFDSQAPLDSGPSTPNIRPKIFDNVGIDQHLDAQLPMDLPFTDQDGKAVKLGDYFKDRPVLLLMIQYSCKNLCTLELNGLCRAANACALLPGRDYDILTISFDPRETAAMAWDKKRLYESQINKDGVAGAWHFLVGSQDSITKVTQAAGCRYVYDAANDQFIHSGALMVCTPDGRLSKYLYGAEYEPNDLRLAVADAGQSKIGSLADEILLFCCRYDPATGRYTLAVRNLLRVAAAITLGSVVLFVMLNLRRERHAVGH
jgi:protein SCO1